MKMLQTLPLNLRFMKFERFMDAASHIAGEYQEQTGGDSHPTLVLVPCAEDDNQTVVFAIERDEDFTSLGHEIKERKVKVFFGMTRAAFEFPTEKQLTCLFEGNAKGLTTLGIGGNKDEITAFMEDVDQEDVQSFCEMMNDHITNALFGTKPVLH